jgi:hypothetical protein
MGRNLCATPGGEASISKGVFREALADDACTENVSLIILGRPAGKGSIFQESRLKEFASELECGTGIEIMIV